MQGFPAKIEPEYSSVSCIEVPIETELVVVNESAVMQDEEGDSVTLETEPFLVHNSYRLLPRHGKVGIVLCIVAAIAFFQVALHAFNRNKQDAAAVDSSTVFVPQVHYNWNGKKCFESNQELKDAVDSYLLDKTNETLGEIYGLPIGIWCVKYVQDFSFVFALDRNDNISDLMREFNDDISGWDVSSAVNLDRMFRGLEWFDQDLNSWNVSNVKSMKGTFAFTRRFAGDIRAWDVSKVTNFAAMFYDTDRFDRNLVYWNVSSAEDMTSMFRNAKRFSHNMCEWGRLIKNTTVVFGMFMNSGCPIESMVGPFMDDPNRVPGPFCQPCE